jgi:hypothetical protein
MSVEMFASASACSTYGNDTKTGISRLPEKRPSRVLFSAVPSPYDKNEAWRNGTLEEALEASKCHKVGPVLRSGHADHANA